jgi:thiol-disulfide isomerase/thioredoxin
MPTAHVHALWHPADTRAPRSWCGPCVLLAAELEKVRPGSGWGSRLRTFTIGCLTRCAVAQVAEELGDAVKIVKVDTDVEQDLASQLQARPQRRARF